MTPNDGLVRRGNSDVFIKRRPVRRRTKKLHRAALNFLSLKSRRDIGASLARTWPDKRRRVSTRSWPCCFSPLNLPGISHLRASHLRITNYAENLLAEDLADLHRCFHRLCLRLFLSFLLSLSRLVLILFCLSSGDDVTQRDGPKVNGYPPSNRTKDLSRCTKRRIVIFVLYIYTHTSHLCEKYTLSGKRRGC